MRVLWIPDVILQSLYHHFNKCWYYFQCLGSKRIKRDSVLPPGGSILPITTPIIKWDFYIHALHPYRSVKVLNSPGYSKHYNWCQAQHLCFIFYFPSSLSGIVTILSLSYVLNLCFSSRIFPPLIFKNIFMCPLKMKRHMIKFLSSPPTSYCYYLISFLYESNRF